MARPIRIDVADGVYHVISRGTERCALFREEADYLHFLDRLGEARRRFRLRIYEYVLMNNHFHLIVATPDANLSQAIQWLKVSYSMWFNAKYSRVGPLFQGRFKGVLVDPDESWLLELSLYVHLNPVRVKRLGLDKRSKDLEAKGWNTPSSQIVAKRLQSLRAFRWSSYPYYAGYKRTIPEWLDTSVLRGMAPSAAAYRKLVETRLLNGQDEGFLSRMKDRLALGGAAFVERIRELHDGGPDYEGLRELHHRRSWSDVVAAVEQVKGTRWDEFAGVRGDWGRAVCYYLARKYTGMTLVQIGQAAGGVNYPAVSQMVKRLERRLPDDQSLQAHLSRADRMLKIQT